MTVDVLAPSASLDPRQALHDPQALFALLDRWVAHGWLRPLDRALAAFLAEQAVDAPAPLLLAAALVSHQLGRGHVCLDLAAALADPDRILSLPPEGDPGVEPPPRPSECLRGLALADWLAALQRPQLVASGAGATPLVLVGDRLYLRRYWQYEGQIRAALLQRLQRAEAMRAALPPPERLRALLDAFFPRPADAGRATDWQKLACALAVGNAFTVITGGPGTGKTTTVVRLLGLLQSLALADAARGRPLRIRLAAPTGKAAARLTESIAGAVQRLPLPAGELGEAVRAAIPTEAGTLHRLLGSRPDSRRFRHHRGNPLQLDVLVVDEASMVDVELMAALLEALPTGSRLVLLGDKDQLASVEAGAVLGELCRRAQAAHYQPATRGWLEAVSGEAIDPAFEDPQGEALDQAIVMLRHSHRFDAGSGIGQLAARVNAGDSAGVRAVWQAAEPFPDLARVELADETDPRLEALAVDGGADRFPAAGRSLPPPVGYRHYLQVLQEAYPGDAAPAAALDAWAAEVLAAYGRFQLLCALRRGPWGVEGLNRRIAQALHARGLIPATEHWYAGRPVLVTRNDHQLGLMNGDIGITLAVPDAAGGRLLRVAFVNGDGSGRIRWVLPSRLNAVETVYAMTVHKSQGSEFVHAALVLPDHPNPVVTRELVYTGITRARDWFTLLTPAAGVLEAAVTRAVERVSGLREGF